MNSTDVTTEISSMDQEDKHSVPITPAVPLSSTSESFAMPHGNFLNTKETIDDSEDSVDENDQEDYKDEEDSRDDEDFVVTSSPKVKKRPQNKTPTKSVKKKRICDFCGCSDTPMWRRGPQGKGTLCNACGVKWSLKARKRTSKKEKGTKEALKLRLDSNTAEEEEEDVESSSPLDNNELKPRKGSPRTKLVLSKRKRGAADDVKMPGTKEYYCKYCGVTWPEKHFKNTQQFGAHCSNCSRKQLRTADESAVEQDSETKLHSPKKEIVKKETHTENTSVAAATDDTDVNANRLLRRLLNVVENRLLEEEEIEDLKKQLSDLRNELIAKEEERKKKLEEARASALNELMEYRREMVALIASKENDINSKIASLGTDSITDVKMQLTILTPLISEMYKMVVDKGNGQGDIVEQLKGLLSQVSAIHQKIDSHFGDLRSQFVNYAQTVCADLNQRVEYTESKMKNGVEQLNREYEKQNLRNSLALLEEVLTS